MHRLIMELEVEYWGSNLGEIVEPNPQDPSNECTDSEDLDYPEPEDTYTIRSYFDEYGTIHPCFKHRQKEHSQYLKFFNEWIECTRIRAELELQKYVKLKKYPKSRKFRQTVALMKYAIFNHIEMQQKRHYIIEALFKLFTYYTVHNIRSFTIKNAYLYEARLKKINHLDYGASYGKNYPAHYHFHEKGKDLNRVDVVSILGTKLYPTLKTRIDIRDIEYHKRGELIRKSYTVKPNQGKERANWYDLEILASILRKYFAQRKEDEGCTQLFSGTDMKIYVNNIENINSLSKNNFISYINENGTTKEKELANKLKQQASKFFAFDKIVLDAKNNQKLNITCTSEIQDLKAICKELEQRDKKDKDKINKYKNALKFTSEMFGEHFKNIKLKKVREEFISVNDKLINLLDKVLGRKKEFNKRGERKYERDQNLEVIYKYQYDRDNSEYLIRVIYKHLYDLTGNKRCNVDETDFSQQLGVIGRSGWSTGPHLHMDTSWTTSDRPKNWKPVSPLLLFPEK